MVINYSRASSGMDDRGTVLNDKQILATFVSRGPGTGTGTWDVL